MTQPLSLRRDEVAGSNSAEKPADAHSTEGLGQWSVIRTDISPQEQLDRLVMAWAKDAQTGEARYILELDDRHKGAKCGCVCYSCGLPLTAVNAAKKQFVVRPHFRHPDGAKKKDCMVLTARAAAIAALKPGDRITLPAKRFGAHVIGLSGQRYEAWVTKPREVVNIRYAHLRDKVTAVLTLDDGREVLVRLTGMAGGGDDDEIHPVIQVEVDDPQLASLDLKELKTRLHLLMETASWCGPHWDEDEQTRLAQAQAQRQAESELDSLWPDAIRELGESLSREGFLHWLAKEILLREKRLMVPRLVYQGEGMGQPFAVKAESSLQLSDVRLEQTRGAIRPDVLARYTDPVDGDSSELLIEVTVTNPLSEERIHRICSQGVAALEIDLRSLGGTLREHAFSRLLVDELVAKRWIYHPWTDVQAGKEADNKALQQSLLLDSTRNLAVAYLSAVEKYSEYRAQDLGTVSWEAEVLGRAREVDMYAKALVEKGYPYADAEELYRRQGSILQRLLSIRKAQPVGYRLDNLWGVYNAIKNDGSEQSVIWHTLYLIAHKVYAPKLSEVHEAKVQELRHKVLDSLRAGENTYRRPRHHDALIGLLFPEMIDAMQRPLPGDGTARPTTEQPTRFRSRKAEAPPRYSSPANLKSQGFPGRPWKDSEAVWLTGADYERWKRENPEAARAWEASRRSAGTGGLE